MTSVNLLIVLVVGALVGTFTGLALGGVVDNLYLAMIAGILATIIAGIVRNTIMTRVGTGPELEGMPRPPEPEGMPQPQLMIIYSAVGIDRRIPLRVIAYSALASLAGSTSALQVATQSGLTSSVLIGTLAGLFSGILMAILLLAYDIPRPKLSLRLPEAEREAAGFVQLGNLWRIAACRDGLQGQCSNTVKRCRMASIASPARLAAR